MTITNLFRNIREHVIALKGRNTIDFTASNSDISAIDKSLALTSLVRDRINETQKVLFSKVLGFANEVDFNTSPTKFKRCKRGYACGRTCISPLNKCRKPLEGQARSYASWLEKNNAMPSIPAASNVKALTETGLSSVKKQGLHTKIALAAEALKHLEDSKLDEKYSSSSVRLYKTLLTKQDEQIADKVTPLLRSLTNSNKFDVAIGILQGKDKIKGFDFSGLSEELKLHFAKNLLDLIAEQGDQKSINLERDGISKTTINDLRNPQLAKDNALLLLKNISKKDITSLNRVAANRNDGKIKYYPHIKPEANDAGVTSIAPKTVSKNNPSKKATETDSLKKPSNDAGATSIGIEDVPKNSLIEQVSAAHLKFIESGDDRDMSKASALMYKHEIDGDKALDKAEKSPAFAKLLKAEYEKVALERSPDAKPISNDVLDNIVDTHIKRTVHDDTLHPKPEKRTQILSELLHKHSIDGDKALQRVRESPAFAKLLLNTYHEVNDQKLPEK